MIETITSQHNPKIKQAVKLQDSKERREQGLILIEGSKEISLAMEAGIKIETVFFCPELAGPENELLLLLNPKTIFHTSKDVFKKIAYREHPEGVLAIGRQNNIELENIKLSKNPLLIIVEAVEKPGNLGAILRSTDAAGADAVIVCDTKTDLYNPNVIRSSVGTVFTNQVAFSSAENVMAWLKEKKIKIFATLPRGSKIYTQADYTGPAAIVVGTEHHGLSRLWEEKADEKIKIDMKGKIDSLNASVSLAIVLFEALRQRNG